MADQDHNTPGASLADRLLRRSRSSSRTLLGEALAARFGLADGGVGDSPLGDDGFVTLSIRPYLQAMGRLAAARQRREARLSRLLERHAARMTPRAFRRLPGMAPRPTGLAALFGSRALDGSDFVLPERADLAVPEAPVEEHAAAPARATYTSSRSPRPAASAWLSTPWSGARVARTPVRTTVVEQAAPAPAAPAATAAPARRRPSALERAGQRSLTVRGTGDRVSRAIEDAAPALERTPRGRALARRLRAAATRPAAEREQIVQRILAQAGAPARAALAPVEAAAPRVSPAQRATERMASTTGPARGLRPVMSRSPGMQALVPAAPPVVDDAAAAPARRARPAAVAAARISERKSAWLSGSPVRRARAARRALSASPVAPSTAPAPAAPRASQASAARVRQAAAGAATDRTPSAVAASAVTAAARSARAARPRARAAGGTTSSSPGDGPSDPGDPAADLAAGLSTPSAPPSARAAWRLAAMTAALADDADTAERDPTAGAALRLAEDGAARARRGAGLAVRRSAAGVYVPARVLATPDAPETTAVPADDVAPPAPARAPAVPTPSRRAEYVQGLRSTATVARTPASGHAASRSALASRPGSVLPATRPGQARSAGAEPAETRTAAVARRLGATRDERGTFVARRARVAAPGTPLRAAVPVASPEADLAGALPTPAGRASGTSSGTSSGAAGATAATPPSLPAQHAAARASASQAPGRSVLPSPVAGGARTRDVAASVDPAARSSAAAPGRASSAPPAAPPAASPVVVAAERASRAPLVGAASRRALDSTPAGIEHRVSTRHRPNPAAYARAFGLSSPDQVVIETVDVPAASGDGTPSLAGAAAETAASPTAAGAAAQALARVEARARAGQAAPRTRQASTAGLPRGARIRWSPALSFDPVVVSHALGASPAQELAATGDLAGSTPTSSEWTGASVASGGGASASASARVARTAQGTYVGARSGSGALPVDWAGARTARTPGRRSDLARSVTTPRGRFDGAGTYRVPRRDVAPRRDAGPRRARVADDFTAVRPDGFGFDAEPAEGFGPGAAGGPAAERPSAWFTGPARPGDDRVRPSFDVTLAAAHAGMDGQGLPVWARRAGGQPLVHREDRFVDALARASTPEDIVRVIYQRAEQGALSAGASGLPAPVLSVIEQIRTVAEGVQAAPDLGDRHLAGPGSDAEVVRRARGGTRAPAASSARVARGSLLRTRGSASRRDGVGSDQISKLSKKLQQLILLAQKQRNAAREEVRMAEDSAAARAEGSAAPGQAEGGNNDKVDIEALGREVLEVVTMELEMRKQRSQEGSDEFGWW